MNLPDRVALLKAHLQAGKGLFPFAVQVDLSGDLRIRTLPGGGVADLQGRRILRINGREAQAVVQEMLAHFSGDTLSFRTELLSRRWPMAYWLLQGAPEEFELTVEGFSKLLRVSASRELPVELRNPSFEQTFHLQLRPEKSAAVLTLNEFWWEDKPRFHAFIEDVYARLKVAKIRRLIIDVRANPGGDDDMWKGPLLRLVAKQPFRNASAYVKKVLPGRASGTEKVGDVVHGQADSWVQPDLESPVRFEGQVYVLVGRFTYSSAVLFANVVQDFGIGQLVGAGGSQRTRQSGGIQKAVPLPHTGLDLFVPRFVLTRPSGQREPELVSPDIVLPDNPFDTTELVEELLNRF
ncbi:S41 family peptidase [Inhella gelatinilytica]|uniref:S41 family peptidase n=1 Tax=Inhella gelatinilytica TaxID=2795030 RepID=A0A931NCC3_9BURK|nr:S41 family peptidase [Inhella gelatinilytica]MBH9551419.1 S41 family peptidase [Inhella gelatinilytica]